jgi:hypothetical protein
MAGIEDILDPDELKLIKERRAQRREAEDKEVWIKSADGHEARVGYGVAKAWLRKVGFDVDDEDPGTAAAAENDQETPEDGDQDKTVRFGRRIS